MSQFIRSVADHAKFGIKFKLSIFAVHSCVVVFSSFSGGHGNESQKLIKTEENAYLLDLCDT